MILCPICEFNYIADDADMCSDCVEIVKKIHTNNVPRKTRPAVVFGEKFVFKNEPASYGRFRGYRVYNNDGENVGIVFMSSDKRSPAYGNCELCFYSKYQDRYGQYHRIKSSCGYIPWRLLCERLNKYGFVEYFID